MKDSEYLKTSQWINEGSGCLVPYNDLAHDLTDTAKAGEIITMLEVSDRDLKFHRAYFSLLNYIYDLLPNRFHKKLDRKHFYTYLKHLKGEFDIIAQFGDIVLVEYESISFASKSEHQFRDYVREILPWIYTKVIGKYYKEGGWRYNRRIECIEDEYLKFLSKL